MKFLALFNIYEEKACDEDRSGLNRDLWGTERGTLLTAQIAQGPELWDGGAGSRGVLAPEIQVLQ
jgi:hypothetical protein